VQGHTDATSTPEHNQQPSERRANSVKNYLVGPGSTLHAFPRRVAAPLDR
jgi:outer membrane protein OmpA-like peptidoglycan-associated protein